MTIWTCLLTGGLGCAFHILYVRNGLCFLSHYDNFDMSANRGLGVCFLFVMSS